MFLALSRGVPEAGLTFALAMMLGIGLTLGTVAALTIGAREWVIVYVSRYGGSIETTSRVLEALTGALLIAVGTREFLR